MALRVEAGSLELVSVRGTRFSSLALAGLFWARSIKVKLTLTLEKPGSTGKDP